MRPDRIRAEHPQPVQPAALAEGSGDALMAAKLPRLLPEGEGHLSHQHLLSRPRLDHERLRESGVQVIAGAHPFPSRVWRFFLEELGASSRAQRASLVQSAQALGKAILLAGAERNLRSPHL